MAKTLYIEAFPLLPTRLMPKAIQMGGGYKVIRLDGRKQLVTKQQFFENFEKVSATDEDDV